MTFTVYTALGNSLDLGKAFATLSFFNFIQYPLSILPRLMAVVADILNSDRASVRSQLMIRKALTCRTYHQPDDCM